MSKCSINFIYQSTFCEICHRLDLFNQQLHRCLRCSVINFQIKEDKIKFNKARIISFNISIIVIFILCLLISMNGSICLIKIAVNPDLEMKRFIEHWCTYADYFAYVGSEFYKWIGLLGLSLYSLLIVKISKRKHYLFFVGMNKLCDINYLLSWCNVIISSLIIIVFIIYAERNY